MIKRQIPATTPKVLERLTWTGGYNSTDDFTKVGANQITLASQNVFFEDELLKKVKGYTQEQNPLFLAGTGVYGLDSYYAESGNRYMMIVAGTHVYRRTIAGDVNIGAVLSGDFRITSVTMNNLWIMANGNDNPRKYIDGVGMSDLLGAPPVAYYVDKFENRCVLARTDALPKRFWFSALNNPQSWNVGADYFEVDEDITAICPAINWFVVFGRNSFYAWNGETDAATAQIVPHKQNIGCVSGNACVSTPYGIAFVGDDNVYLTDGIDTKPIGENIKTIIEAIALKQNIVIRYKDNKVYIFYTPSGGARNSTMLIGELNVSAGSGSVRWSAPIAYPGNVATFFSYTFNAEEELFFGIPDDVIIYQGFDGDDFDGADIDGIADFKVSDTGRPEFKKKEKKVFVAAHAAAAGATIYLTIGISYDGSGYFETQDIPLDPSIWYMDAGFNMDAGLFFDLGKILMGSYIRVKGKHRWTQLRIRNENADEPFIIYDLGRVYRPVNKFK